MARSPGLPCVLLLLLVSAASRDAETSNWEALWRAPGSCSDLLPASAWEGPAGPAQLLVRGGGDGLARWRLRPEPPCAAGKSPAGCNLPKFPAQVLASFPN